MEKVITISNKNYKMKASALTQFSYKDETGRNFINDLKEVTNKTDSKELENNIDVLDDITEILLKIAYIMIKEADKTQVGSYNEFLSEIDNLYDEPDWITNVISLGTSPISRQLQKNK